MSTFWGTDQILGINPDAKVIILTTESTSDDRERAARARAKGLISKELTPRAMISAIRDILGMK